MSKPKIHDFPLSAFLLYYFDLVCHCSALVLSPLHPAIGVLPDYVHLFCVSVWISLFCFFLSFPFSPSFSFVNYCSTCCWPSLVFFVLWLCIILDYCYSGFCQCFGPCHGHKLWIHPNKTNWVFRLAIFFNCFIKNQALSIKSKRIQRNLIIINVSECVLKSKSMQITFDECERMYHIYDSKTSLRESKMNCFTTEQQLQHSSRE